jgi:hypothetical protein
MFLEGGSAIISTARPRSAASPFRGTELSSRPKATAAASRTGAHLTARNSTITANSSLGYGGGIESYGTLNARNTIIAGNFEGGDLYGTVTSGDHNLIGVDPLLGPLQDNGGPTFTHALLPGSPAIDAGDNTDAPQWDQRGPGFRRIVGGDIDIGAFERQKVRPPLHGVPDITTVAVTAVRQDPHVTVTIYPHDGPHTGQPSPQRVQEPLADQPATPQTGEISLAARQTRDAVFGRAVAREEWADVLVHPL